MEPVHMNPQGKIEIVYSPKSFEERRRRADRAHALVGTPWVKPQVPLHKVILEVDGHLIRAEGLGTIFNDACLMDAISDWGQDGPLYRDTLDEPMASLYIEALKLYEGVEIPFQIRNPNTPDGHPPGKP